MKYTFLLFLWQRKRAIFSCMSLFIILFLGLFTHHYLHTPGPSQIDKIILIPSPSSLHAISTLLEKETIITDKIIFFALSVLYTHKKSYQAGEYAISKNASPADIMQLLRSGKIHVHKFFVPEGLTVKQITEFLLSEKSMTGNIPKNIEEGSLFPNTYHYLYGEKRENLLAKMQKNQKDILQKQWDNRDPSVPFSTPQEALILASIVEKEAKLPSERTRIARVFINRLELHMRLQADPTTLYAVSEGRGILDRPLYEKDLKILSPYNTYVVKGLPPTPICNPGEDALYATLHPIASNDLYFVANGQGGHFFGSTLAEHNKNVALYRTLQKNILSP